MNNLYQFRVVIDESLTSIPFIHDYITICITSPSGRPIRPHIINTSEGCLVNFVPIEMGQYLISVTLAGSGKINDKPNYIYCLPEHTLSVVNPSSSTLPGSKQVNQQSQAPIDLPIYGRAFADGSYQHNQRSCLLLTIDIFNILITFNSLVSFF